MAIRCNAWLVKAAKYKDFELVDAILLLVSLKHFYLIFDTSGWIVLSYLI